MPSLNALLWVVAALSILTTLVAIYRRKIKPVVQRLGGGVDVLVGRGAFFDHATGKRVAEVPALGTALAQMRNDINEQGKSLSDLTSVVAQVADQQVQLKNLDTRVTAIERHEAERVASKLESAAFLNAVAKRDSDVIDVQTEP